MDNVAKGFGKAVGHLVRLNSKVTKIQQGEKGVTAEYVDTKTGAKMTASADYCICTIPLPVLSQIPINVGPALDAAIHAIPYSTSVKVGLEFKRRFWSRTTRFMAASPSPTCPTRRSAIRAATTARRGRAFCWALMWAARRAMN